jgi:hypothetical protein
MAGFTGTLTAQVIALLTSATSGVNARITSIEANDSTLKGIGIRSIVPQNVSIEISESAGQAQYPALLVYCDRVQNLLQEKYRAFSGRVHLVIEVRQTQESLDLIERNTEMYVDAVCALLGEARGDWGDGASYSGGYQVNYEPVAKGGKNFIQRAKVNFAVELSE